MPDHLPTALRTAADHAEALLVVRNHAAALVEAIGAGVDDLLELVDTLDDRIKRADLHAAD